MAKIKDNRFKLAHYSWCVGGIIGLIYAISISHPNDIDVLIIGWVLNGLFWGWLGGFLIDKIIDFFMIKPANPDVKKTTANSIFSATSAQSVSKQKSDPHSEAFGGFQDEFTKEQKAVMIIVLMNVVSANSQKTITQSENNYLMVIANLIGISLDDPMFNTIYARLFIYGGEDYYQQILNEMSQSNKEWYVLTLNEMVMEGGQEMLSDQIEYIMKIALDIGISSTKYMEIIGKATAIYNKIGRNR